MDNQGFAASVLYRLSYGIAADRAEASRHDTLHSRRHQAEGGAAEEIDVEVLAQVGCPAPVTLETTREAVADALAGRWPQW